MEREKEKKAGDARGIGGRWRPSVVVFLIATLSGCLVAACASDSMNSGASAESTATAVADAEAAALAERVAAIYPPFPTSVPHPESPSTEARTDLGRMLYYDERLSKNHDISCNSCHQLDAFGVDGEATSPGHRGQRGARNSPTVYNAALHVAQFWDGREPDVEAQAKGPVLNPIEMAAPSEAHIVEVLRSIPGYAPAFAAAFPDSEEPISYDNMARAIGAFERNLLTPGRFDAFLAGDATALSEQEMRGLGTFLTVGCNTCHTGPAIGGQLYRKLGFIFPYETADPGLETLSGNESDRHTFKVPSLRNIAETGPYFHDGSIETLEEVVEIMAYHQAGQKLDANQIADVVAFLGSLTGEVDAAYIARPELPESGPETPAPDPE